MVVFLTPIFSAIFAGYIFTIPIARFCMMECTPTLFASAMTAVSGVLAASLFVPAMLSWIPVSDDILSIIIVIVTFILAIITYIVEIRGPIPDFVDMRGKTVLVTGANSGIGLETARQLMLMGATVVLGCRSPSRAKAAYNDLSSTLAKHQSAATNANPRDIEAAASAAGKVVLLDTPLDLSSLKSVREYVRAYKEAGLGLDVLVCNAGMIPAGFAMLKEERSGERKGMLELESTFAANHLGHHLLIKLMLPMLKESYEQRQKVQTAEPQAWAPTAPSRIVIVSSSLHKAARGADSLGMHTDAATFESFAVYGRSKLTNLLGAHKLHKLLKADKEYRDAIVVNALHPGNPVTSVTGNLPAYLRVLEKMFYPFMFLYRETCTAGAYCSVWTATHKEAIKKENQYYIDSASARKNVDAENDEYADKMFFPNYEKCASLFQPLAVGRMHLKHRIVLAPLTRMRADENLCPTRTVVEYYSQRASAGGLLISEATEISPQTISSRYVPGIWTDAQVAAWRQVTEAVHAKGGYIYCQLWHMGRCAHASYTQHPLAQQREAKVCVSASAVPYTGDKAIAFDGTPTPHEAPHALTEEEIEGVVHDYRRAAERAIEAGFDGVEVHGAHGYLIDQFLNDGVNQRSDMYGGSVENRCRLLDEVLAAICGVLGSDRVALRLSPHDNTNSFSGVTDSNPEQLYTEAFAVAERHNLSYLLVTEPRWDPMSEKAGKSSDWGNLPCVNALTYGDKYSGIVIGGGGFTPISGADAVRRGLYDMAAFGRWFISTPDLVLRIQRNLPLNEYNRFTFYHVDRSEHGYTDYPSWSEVCDRLLTWARTHGNNPHALWSRVKPWIQMGAALTYDKSFGWRANNHEKHAQHPHAPSQTTAAGMGRISQAKASTAAAEAAESVVMPDDVAEDLVVVSQSAGLMYPLVSITVVGCTTSTQQRAALSRQRETALTRGADVYSKAFGAEDSWSGGFVAARKGLTWGERVHSQMNNAATLPVIGLSVPVVPKVMTEHGHGACEEEEDEGALCVERCTSREGGDAWHENDHPYDGQGEPIHEDMRRMRGRRNPADSARLVTGDGIQRGASFGVVSEMGENIGHAMGSSMGKLDSKRPLVAEQRSGGEAGDVTDAKCDW